MSVTPAGEGSSRPGGPLPAGAFQDFAISRQLSYQRPVAGLQGVDDPRDLIGAAARVQGAGA
jgi:hypothetical protein